MKRWTCVLSLLPLTLVHGDTLVVPSRYANVDSPGAGGLPGLEFQYQEVFDALNFSNLPAGGVFISGFSWRPDNSDGQGSSFDGTLASVEVSASTTTRSSLTLSPIFSQNVGADVSLVRTAAPLHISGTHPPTGPSPFSITVSFDTPFKYDPSKGNLLLEILGMNAAVGTGNLDYSSPDGHQGIALGERGDLSSQVLVYGPVTEFTYAVPEPAIWQLGVAGVSLLWFLRVRNQKDVKISIREKAHFSTGS